MTCPKGFEPSTLVISEQEKPITIYVCVAVSVG